MNIGDKVRFLRGNEEGIVTKIMANDLIEVEIEDGFHIPVVKREVVVVSKEEQSHFGKQVQPQSTDIPKPKVYSNSGVYLSFAAINDDLLNFQLINNTDWLLPYSIGEEIGASVKGLKSGILEIRSHVKITEVSLKDFESWPVWIIQLLFHRNESFSLREPLVKKLKMRAATFYKSKQKAPLLNKDAFVFQIDMEIKTIDPEQLKEKLLTSSEPVQQLSIKLPPPSREVDLHIEKLVADHTKMSNSEMIRIQMSAFEKALDSAIGAGLDEITFIHGVGNGVLRQNIQKVLSKMEGIKYFEDARKEKFGYGATLVKIK